MIRIAVLGDIGSGKSYVAKKFGYPVFSADVEVAKLYNKNRKYYNKYKPKFFGKKKLFYDVIYNPGKTNFLSKGKESGNETTNGKMMFICQAQLAFKIWHNILPKIDNETINLLENQTTSLFSIGSKF